MAADVSAPLPDEPLAPGSTIEVTLDDASAVITKLNVYGVTPAREETPEFEVLPPLLGYGAEQ